MTFIWIFLGALSFVTINWRLWHEYYEDGSMWIEQAVRFVVGFIWGLIGANLVLMDITFSAWFIWFGIPIALVHARDWYLAYEEDGEYNLNTFMEVVITIGLVLGYVGMITIYPISITKSTYDLANSYVTIVDTAVPETETANIGLVSERTAKRLANPKIAELGNSSKYTFGVYTKQSINGEVVWVTPVEYAGTFRAKGSTPGYFVVDVFDTTKEVKTVDGMDFKYMPSAIFSKDLKRHVHGEIPTKVLFTEMFQVDDEGNAFWVIPYGHYKYFRFVPEIEGIAIVNPTTGEINCYTVDEVPAWVDTVIPGDIAETYGNYYGSNKHGWWAKMAPTDQFALTVWEGDDAWSIVYDENGTMWYATDTTTLNADKSMVGYMMINARTMEIKYFPNVSGINGKGVSENFIQLYKEKSGWSPVEPTLYNIYGTLTWFSTMVDENGAIQAYCLGDTNAINVVGETTISDALMSYKRKLATTGIESNPTAMSDTKTIQGIVDRVIITDGRTKILMNQRVYVIEQEVSVIAQFTKEGDTVKMVYLDTQEAEIFALEFENLTLE